MTLRTLTVRSCYCREGGGIPQPQAPNAHPSLFENHPGQHQRHRQDQWRFLQRRDGETQIAWSPGASGKGPGAGAVQPTEGWAMVPAQAWRQTLGSEELKTSWHQAFIHLPLPYQDFSNQGQAPPSRAAAGGLPGSTGL